MDEGRLSRIARRIVDCPDFEELELDLVAYDARTGARQDFKYLISQDIFEDFIESDIYKKSNDDNMPREFIYYLFDYWGIWERTFKELLSKIDFVEDPNSYKIGYGHKGLPLLDVNLEIHDGDGNVAGRVEMGNSRPRLFREIRYNVNHLLESRKKQWDDEQAAREKEWKLNEQVELLAHKIKAIRNEHVQMAPFVMKEKHPYFLRSVYNASFERPGVDILRDSDIISPSYLEVDVGHDGSRLSVVIRYGAGIYDRPELDFFDSSFLKVRRIEMSVEMGEAFDDVVSEVEKALEQAGLIGRKIVDVLERNGYSCL